MTRTHSKRWRAHFSNFTNFARSSEKPVCARTLLCRVSMLSCTTSSRYASSALLTASAHRLPSRSISRQSRFPGGHPAATTPLARCLEPTRAVPRLRRPAWSLAGVVCCKMMFIHTRCDPLAYLLSAHRLQWMLASVMSVMLLTPTGQQLVLK